MEIISDKQREGERDDNNFFLKKGGRGRNIYIYFLLGERGEVIVVYRYTDIPKCGD